MSDRSDRSDGSDALAWARLVTLSVLALAGCDSDGETDIPPFDGLLIRPDDELTRAVISCR